MKPEMHWIIQLPNGEYAREIRYRSCFTWADPQFARCYTRRVAHAFAKQYGGKAVRLEEALSRFAGIPAATDEIILRQVAISPTTSQEETGN